MVVYYDEEIVRNRSKYLYWIYCKQTFCKCAYDLSDEEVYILNLKYDSLSNEDKKCYDRYINNVRLRKWRLRQRIEFMLLHFPCSFITFTLNDEHVNVNPHILRTMICRVLKECNCYYVGNIDFGKTTERMHFHFIVARDDIKKYIKQRYCKDLNYGFIDFKRVTNKNAYRLSNYIDKLVNHSFKESTMKVSKANIITSRGEYAFTKLDL